MNTHIKTVGILYLVFGSLTMFTAVVVLLSFGTVGGIVVAQGEHEAAGILGVVMLGVCGLLSLLALPELIGGWALLTGRPWGRNWVLVLGFISLLNIPFGTLLGIYTLWALLRDDEAMASQAQLA